MTKKQKRDRHVFLSWKIIEHKLMYYYPDKVAPEHHETLVISDESYDLLEKEYLSLCCALDLPNTVVHKGNSNTPVNGEMVPKGDGMMEVDFSRPSVQLVLKKYGVPDDQTHPA